MHLFTMLLLPLVAAAGFGAEIRGAITDGQAALPGVTVRITQPANLGRQVLSGPDGTFALTELPPGRYTLTFARAGFESLTRTVEVGATPEAIEVVLRVSGVATTLEVTDSAGSSALQLDSTATGGTLLNIPVRELPASISIVSQQMMQERGVRTAIEAAEQTVGMIAGHSVGSIPNFSARGFAGNNITVMRDGIRQNTASQSSRPLDSFLMERMEVLRGPASILYGEGAIGAAVNYVTKEAQPRFLTDALVSYGSFNSVRAGAGINGPLRNNLFLRADASYFRTDGYMDDSRQNLSGVNTGLRYNISDSITLNVNGTWMQDFTESYYGTPLINGRIDPRTRFLNYNMRDNLAKSKNRFGRATLDWQLSPNWHFRNYFFAATHTLDWRNFESYAYNPNTQRVDVGSYLLIWRNDLLVGNRSDIQGTVRIFGRTLRTVAGVQYQNNDMRRGGLSDNTLRFSVDPFQPAPIIDPGRHYVRDRDVIVRTVSLFSEAVYDLTSRLKVIGGFRWEQINVDYLTRANNQLAATRFRPPTGRVGMLYNVTPTWNLYGSYTRAVEPVTQLVSLSGANQVFSLVPGEQLEFGSKATFLRNRVDFTGAWYNLEKRDILTRTIVDGLNIAQQIGRQIGRGVELSALARPTATLTVSADYAWIRGRFADFNEIVAGGNVSRSGNVPQNVPGRVVGIWANQRVGRLDLSTNIRHVGRRFADTANLRVMDAYTVVDAAVSWRLPGNSRLALRGRNLGDALYAAWSASGGTALRLEAPRSVDVTWTLRF